MYIVLQDASGHAAGHMYLHEQGGSLYLRQGYRGEGVLLSAIGERWGLSSPCPFAPVGAVVVEGDNILCRGLAPGQKISLQELEALYLHPPVQEKEEKPEQKKEELEKIPEKKVEMPIEKEEKIEEQPPSVEDAQAAAAVFAALMQEAGRVYGELEGQLPSMPSSIPQNGKQWMEDTEKLLKGIKKEPAEGFSESTRSFPIDNPFPYAFPGASFHRVWGRGVLEHLEGEWRQGGRRYTLTAVPGAPALRPPKHLQGFTRYVRTGRGGYWVKISPLF